MALVLAGADAGAGTPAPDLQGFIAEAFSAPTPAAAYLWLEGARRDAAAAILGHAPRGVRVRYWQRGERSAWVLDEVGHTHPITAGFVIEGGRVVTAKVLMYRETRGGEVQRPRFLAQFIGRGLDDARRLDGPIDGITGATLSVEALSRMARLALYLASEAVAVGASDGG